MKGATREGDGGDDPEARERSPLRSRLATTPGEARRFPLRWPQAFSPGWSWDAESAPETRRGRWPDNDSSTCTTNFWHSHLPADLLNRIAVQVALHGELAAGLKVSGCDFTCAALIATFCMMICSRCHGTISLILRCGAEAFSIFNTVVKQGHQERRERP